MYKINEAEEDEIIYKNAIQLSIGDKYSLSFNTDKTTDNTEALLSTIFKKLEEMAPSLNFSDKEAGTSFKGNLESIMNYMYKAKKKDTKGVAKEIRIDSPVFGIKGGYWSDLIKQFEFLKADQKDNQVKAGEFVEKLLNSLCHNFHDVFLKGEKAESCSFQDYLGHVWEEFQIILGDPSVKEENYFQRKYFQLKQDLTQQQDRLVSLFKLQDGLNMNQVYNKIRQNYEDTGKRLTEITNTAKDLCEMAIDTGIEKELLKLKNRLTETEKEFSEIEQTKSDHTFKKDDGQFLPFHRVKSKLGYRNPMKNESKNSTSFQTSKYYYSEKVSYDSLDEEETLQHNTMRYSSNQPLAPRPDKMRRNMSGMVELKPGDRINELVEESKNQNCSLHDIRGADCYTLELENRKLKDILAELDIIAEEYFEKDDDSIKIVNENELNDKVEYLINLENSFNMLNLKYLKIQDQYKVLKNSSSPVLSDKFQTEPSSINKDIQLESLEEEKQSLYNELISEKKKNDHLSHLSDQFKTTINSQKETLSLKEQQIKTLTIQTEKLKGMFQNKLLPQIRKYRMEFDQLYMLVTTNALTYDLLGYKELVNGKMEYWREQCQSKEQECDSLSSALQTIVAASTEKKYIKQAVVNDKLSKLSHMLSTFNYERYDRALKGVNNKIKTLSNRYLNIIEKCKEKLEKLNNSNQWLAEQLERCKEEISNQSDDHRQEVEDIKEKYKEMISELNQDQSDKTLYIVELEGQIEELQNNETTLTNRHKEETETLHKEMQNREMLLIEKNKLIDELELVSKHGRETVTRSDTDDKEKDLENMKMMNTKLINELDALNKQLGRLREEKDSLDRKLKGLEDQDENLKELTMQNNLLHNRIEVLESDLNYRRSSDEYLRFKDNTLVQWPSKETTSEYRETTSDQDNFNKTIEEVSEKFEMSEMETSNEFKKNFHSNKDSMYKQSDSKSIKPLYIDKAIQRKLIFCQNFTYSQEKDFDCISETFQKSGNNNFALCLSPPLDNKKRSIFNKESIMKSIEAIKRSGISSKNEKRKDADSVAESDIIIPAHFDIKNKIDKLKNLINKQESSLNKIINEANLDGLSEKLKRLEFILFELEVKQESFNKTMTDKSYSKRNNSQVFEISKSESRMSHNIISSIMDTNKISRDSVNKSTNKEKLFSGKSKGKVKQNSKNKRFEELQKSYGNKTGKKRKANNEKKNKAILFKPNKTIFHSSFKYTPKEFKTEVLNKQKQTDEVILELEQKLLQQQIESRNNIETLQLQVDKLKNEADSDELQKVHLRNELEEITEKNNEYKERIEKVFEIASELVRDQIDSDVLMKSEYVDRVMEFVKTKMENYENSILSLEEEIEILKQEMYQIALEEEQVEERQEDDESPREPFEEVDLEEKQNKSTDPELEDNYKTNFTEKQHMVKQAFEELLTNMFTVVTTNLEHIVNLEELIIPFKDAIRMPKEGDNVDVPSMANEIEQVKNNTTDLREMVECMYDNLMEFLEELQGLQFNNTERLSDNNLIEENKYLQDRMEEITVNYQELNEKYQNLLEDGNSQQRDLDIAIEEPGEENNEDDSEDFLKVNPVHHNTQKQMNNEENSSEYFEEQIDGLNFVVSKIYQVIRSEKTSDYKIHKITEILDSQEMR